METRTISIRIAMAMELRMRLKKVRLEHRWIRMEMARQITKIWTQIMTGFLIAWKVQQIWMETVRLISEIWIAMAMALPIR